MLIREVQKEEISQMAKIAQTCMPFPWDETLFEECFAIQGYSLWGVEEYDQLIGFVVVFIYADECQLMNMAILPEFQHKGYGQALLNHLIYYCKTNQVAHIFLEVRESNQKAIRFYERSGFHAIGFRKDYYPSENGQREDAKLLAWTS